jgi:transcriptional regulator with XRE-family HTH domain
MDYKQVLGRRIKKYRRAAGMDQRQLGAALGVTNTMISFYETGRNVPTLPRFLAMCAALDCSPNELLPVVSLAN